MRTSTEIIESLYKNGNITFEEALQLGMQAEKKEPEAQPSSKATIDSLTDELYTGIITELDVPTIVDYMTRTNWTWGGKPVDEIKFKDAVKLGIQSTVRQAIDHVHNIDISPDRYSDIEREFGWSTGGIVIRGWFNDSNQLSVSVSFEIESSEYSNDNPEDIDDCAKHFFI